MTLNVLTYAFTCPFSIVIDSWLWKQLVDTFKKENALLLGAFPSTANFAKVRWQLYIQVTSDDLPWCEENLRHPRVIFPRLETPRGMVADPAVVDFILMTQVGDM